MMELPRWTWSFLFLIGLVLAGGLLYWLSLQPADQASASTSNDGRKAADPSALRIALIPERNIFEQRLRYRILTDHLAQRTDQPIRLVTLSSYAAVLDEMEHHRIDGAFLGSFVAVSAHEKLGAKVIAKPEHSNGVSTYRGVVFVRDDSPVSDIDGLTGKSIAMVRSTTAGHLFPMYLMKNRQLLNAPGQWHIRWVGTHDDVVREVISGRVDAGAAKDLRVDSYRREHPEAKLRHLAVSDPVPENALVLSSQVGQATADRLRAALLAMDSDEAGRKALKAFGAKRFLPCSIEQYEEVYRMTEALDANWTSIGTSELGHSSVPGGRVAPREP